MPPPACLADRVADAVNALARRGRRLRRWLFGRPRPSTRPARMTALPPSQRRRLPALTRWEALHAPNPN